MAKKKGRSNVTDFSELPLFEQFPEIVEEPLQACNLNVVSLSEFREKSRNLAPDISSNHLDRYLRFAEKLGW